MRLCRFVPDRLGLAGDDRVWPVTEALEMLPQRRWGFPPGDPVIAQLHAILAAARALRPKAACFEVADRQLLGPVANPSKIIGVPVNYQAHLDEASADSNITLSVQAAPIDRAGLFLKANSALAGPSEPIRLCFPDRRTDHEAEVAVAIGVRAQCPGLTHVAGYCWALDVTVRGSEDRSFRKPCERYAVLGPWLTTADELGDPGHIAFSLTANGALRQASTTERPIRDIPELIAWASRLYTLYPGNVLRMESDVPGTTTTNIFREV